MNLKRIKDSDNTIEVGNENSYAKCLNSLNYVEKCKLQTTDFKVLESEFDKGTKLTYKVSNNPIEGSILTLKANNKVFININN